MQWVTQFDPHNVNTLDLELPSDLVAYYEYASTELKGIQQSDLPQNSAYLKALKKKLSKGEGSKERLRG